MVRGWGNREAGRGYGLVLCVKGWRGLAGREMAASFLVVNRGIVYGYCFRSCMGRHEDRSLGIEP